MKMVSRALSRSLVVFSSLRPVLSFASARSLTNNPSVCLKSMSDEDPYTWLHEVESKESLDFAKDNNAACLKALGQPEDSETKTYEKVLSVLESDDRIPHVSQYGINEKGEPVLYNFWKDKANPKGLLRRTTMDSYKSGSPEWETVLDVDDLAKKDEISWVYKGSRGLPRSRDPTNGKLVTRSLLMLSDGGADATYLKEFDHVAKEFVTDRPFNLPEAKTRASYGTFHELS